MVPVLSLLIPIALSAVFVFIASSIIHMATPWHKNDLKKFPNEDDVLRALRGLNLKPGNYGVPKPDSMKEMQTPEFQAKVLRGASAIPFGQARPYAWVAKRIGHPGAVRAVGTALGKNPVPLIVPCHRVLKSDGGVGGYIFGTRFKGRLLEIERTTPVLEGCTSTRIVCRVGCAHLRRAKPENRVVFASVEDARSVGYRPCQVCRPAKVA